MKPIQYTLILLAATTGMYLTGCCWLMGIAANCSNCTVIASIVAVGLHLVVISLLYLAAYLHAHLVKQHHTKQQMQLQENELNKRIEQLMKDLSEKIKPNPDPEGDKRKERIKIFEFLVKHCSETRFVHNPVTKQESTTTSATDIEKVKAAMALYEIINA